MTQEEILVEQLCEGSETYKKHPLKVLISSFTAGLEIGFTYLLISVVFDFAKDRVATETAYYLMAFAYPVGFIMVVLGRSILFTEQTSLLTLPVIDKKRSVLELLKLWCMVIAGNISGGFLMTFLLGWIAIPLGVLTYDSMESIAHHVLDFEYSIIFGSAILAGWLMALLSWLVTSSNETISRIIMIYMITALVGFAGLHHSIVGSIEVFSAMIYTESVTFMEYLGFLFAALAGNAVGGVVFVALLKYRAFAANY